MKIKREEINFILQKADLKDLRNIYEKLSKEYVIRILQNPTQQTLLQPVRDPISEGEFYAGEILCTTAIVQIGENSRYKGWAMVQDDDPDLSLYVAVCDAAFGAGYLIEEIENLVLKTQDKIESEQKSINQKVNATKVSFDLMS